LVPYGPQCTITGGDEDAVLGLDEQESRSRSPLVTLANFPRDDEATVVSHRGAL
jgi:hypothetical protein